MNLEPSDDQRMLREMLSRALERSSPPARIRLLEDAGHDAECWQAFVEMGLPLLRVAQGSATVALTTTAGLISAAVADADLSSFQISLLVIAIAAGATVLSHVNDSGFWLVSRFFGMDVKTTLKTWTVMETTLGLSAFAIALALWVVA